MEGKLHRGTVQNKRLGDHCRTGGLAVGFFPTHVEGCHRPHEHRAGKYRVNAAFAVLAAVWFMKAHLTTPGLK